MSNLYRNYKTKADLDAAYDVESSVPDFTVYARQYVEESADTRRRLRCELDVPFGPSAEEYCDIFPASAPGAPVLIFIHGGYWRILTAGDHSFAAAGLAANDVTVVVANYALCPKVGIDEITRQMRALVAWTYNNVARFNGNPERLFVAGHSAGAHLTAMCALTDWKRDYNLDNRVIKGIIPISGLFDLEPLQYTFLQDDLRITDPLIQSHSPLRILRSVPVPMLISYGMDEPDEFLRHSTEFLKGWQEAGNAARLYPQEGRNHFNAITDLADPKSDMVTTILRFMNHRPSRRLSPGVPGSSARPTWEMAKQGRLAR